MDCPPLKKLQSWIDDRCDLNDAEMEHVQRCAHCLQFLNKTSQSFGLENPSVLSANDSFHEEAEFLALQGRLKGLSQDTLDDTVAEEAQDFRNSERKHDDGDVDLKGLQDALPASDML